MEVSFWAVHETRAQKICASWKCSEHLRCRPRDMMKIPEQIWRGRERPQHRGEGDQVIVVNPHQIVWQHKLRKCHCECAIDSQVAGIVGP
jgi:hypothetical protein